MPIRYLPFILLLSSFACRCAAQGSVPPEYQPVYDELDGKLKTIDSAISASWNGVKHPPVVAVDLLVADANRGEVLLAAQTWQGVLVTLDRLQDLGVTGVKLSVAYPILVPGFPRAAEYADFFTRVSAEVKRRGMKLLISSGTIFPNPALSGLPVDYTGLTIERYAREKRQMMQNIVDVMRPDYLTIENEPSTMQMNTKLPFTVQNQTAIVKSILDSLDRKGIAVGAGMGTWENIAYVQSLLANTAVDYIDIHIYPIQRDYVIDKTARIGGMVRAAGKALIVGECWLYKLTDAELGTTPGTEETIFARDAFSFFIPLDERFIAAVLNLSHWQKIDFACFFWMKYLFGYLDYSPAMKTMTPVQIMHASDSVAARGILFNALSETGRRLKELIAGLTDVSLLQATDGARLMPNYPNPFTGRTTVPVSFPPGSHGALTIHDLLGRKVLDLSGLLSPREAGIMLLVLDAADLPGPGTYLLRFTTTEGTQVRTIRCMK